MFSKVYFSKFTLHMLVFHVLSSNMPSILLEHVDMGAHDPISKLQIHFSNIGNLFPERITISEKAVGKIRGTLT